MRRFNLQDQLRWAQRRRPLKAARKIWRMAVVFIATLAWYCCTAAYGALSALATFALRAAYKAECGMSRLHHVLHPFDCWGGVDNYKVQKQYDELGAMYDRVGSEERNCMVPTATGGLPFEARTLHGPFDGIVNTSTTIGSCKGADHVN